MKSMTGYGKATLAINSREYQIELRSVNHRYLDINVRMPKTLSFLEDDIKKEISKEIKRGKIDVIVTFINNNVETKDIKINTDIARIYINEFKKIAKEEQISSNIEITEISKLPDVLVIEDKENEEELRKELILVTKEALNKLVEMRKNEAKQISKDLLERILRIKEEIEEISKLSTGLIEEYVVKLENRIKEILKTEEVDQTRLAQEVVIYADKCSVEEELTRLRSHLFQLEKAIKDGDNQGKMMDFIIQEMNREANTIGSKANNLEITNNVIKIKTQIENIREQVQNIE